MGRPLKLTAANALTLRGHTWWFLLTVPKPLRERLGGQTRFRFSLQTTDRTVALAKAEVFIQEIKQQLLEVEDPASSYFIELSKLRGVSKEEADELVMVLDPEYEPSHRGVFYAARQIAQDKAPPAELFTLRSIAQQYAEKQSERNAAVTRGVVDRFGPDVPVAHIDRKMVGDYVDARREGGAKKSTVDKDLSALNMVYRYAQRLGVIPWMETTVFQKVQQPPDDQTDKTEPMPDHIYRQLMDDLGDDRWIIVVSRLTGLRPSEVASVYLDERDGVPVWINRHSKTKRGRARIVPVHSAIRDIAEQIQPFLTTKHKERGAKNLHNWKHRKRPPYADLGRYINTYSCRVNATTEMSAAPGDVRRSITKAPTVHTGYIHEHDVHSLVEAIEMIKSPIADYSKYLRS